MKNILILIAVLFNISINAQSPKDVHNKKQESLVITNAIIIDGNGSPAKGPFDILIKNEKITSITPSKQEQTYPDNYTIIDAKGKYVLPGFINMHGHLMNKRSGMDMPYEYQYKLWLACGITTIRDLGSDFEASLKEQAKSKNGAIIAPRIFLYPMFKDNNKTEEEIRSQIRIWKKQGADGVKCLRLDKETFAVVADECKKLGLRIAHHVGVVDTDALDDAKGNTTTIEHWYGIPDAAIESGQQNFPGNYNWSVELDRFRYGGRLWREANQEKLKIVLQTLIDSNVAWDPTLSIYEASRDLQKAITQPYFDAYLHPALAKFFEPSEDSHGSFFNGWTNTDEVYWKENYKIWMKALVQFENMGGIITTGEDAGFIYRIFGFGYLRELQLHEEAGFHPIEVIQHATQNSAKILGMEGKLGRVKAGYIADLIIVNSNPLENLQVLEPAGYNKILDQQANGKRGIEWTIKKGIPYHAPTLLEAVRDLIAKAKK